MLRSQMSTFTRHTLSIGLSALLLSATAQAELARAVPRQTSAPKPRWAASAFSTR
jgi:hypothetical protein